MHKLAAVLGGQPELQREAWNRLLGAAAAWLGGGWSLATPVAADVCVVCLDGGEQNRKLWRQCKQAYPLGRLVAAVQGAPPPDAEWVVALDEGQTLPALADLVNVLLRLAEAPGAGPAGEEADFDANAHLQGIVVEALSDGAPRICELGGANLYLDPGEDACHVAGELEEALPFCLAPRRDIKVSPIDADELARRLSFASFNSRLTQYAALDAIGLLDRRKYQRHSLGELLWFATLANSRGRLLPGHDRALEYQLGALPDFAWDRRYQPYHALARLWQQDFASVEALAALTGASRRQLIDFHNACALVGRFEVRPAAPPPPKAEEAAAPAADPIGRLYRAFMREQRHTGIKIVFAGMDGAGKNSAIATLSDCVARASGRTEPSSFNAADDMVSVKFAEIHLRDVQLFVYGTPGLRRLEFMGQALCANAWGLVVMIDNSAANPLAELDYYMELYRKCPAGLRVAVAVTHFDESGSPGLDEYARHLEQYHFGHPAWVCDPRDEQSMLAFLNKLAELPPGGPEGTPRPSF